MQTYPETYLHVYECRSGQEWIVPMRGNSSLDLRKQVAKWAKREFSGELAIDGKIMPKLDGDYYAKIVTDGRPPKSVVCWDGGGFYLKPARTKLLAGKSKQPTKKRHAKDHIRRMV